MHHTESTNSRPSVLLRIARSATLRWLVLALCSLGAMGHPVAAQAPSVTLRILIVATADESARALARLQGGDDFATLAKAISIDPSAPDGGWLGTLELATLRPEIRDALVGVAAGGITNAVPVPVGFAILKVERPNAPSSGAGGANPGLTAVGSVKYALGVGGLNEVQAALDQYAKAPDWNATPKNICDTRRASLAQRISTLEAAVGTPERRRELSRIGLMQTHYGLGQLYAYLGRMDDAITQFNAAHAIIEQDVSPFDPVALQLQEALGVAWLQKSTMDNHVDHKPGDHCLLSTTGLRPFPRTEASAKAAAHFRTYLTHRPDELEVKWLLNLAYMTMGGYPQDVPPAWLIPADAFASADDIGRFVDVAAAAGLESVAMAGAAIVDDFDNDGIFEVVTSSYDSCAPMQLFRRSSNGRFTEQGARAGLAEQLGGLNGFQADYDNDGCLDILLLRGAWDRPQRKSLLRNDCRGGFTDVTVASGLGSPITSTQAAVWTDIDNDGFLDLFVGNEGGPAQLYRNLGNGTFEDIAPQAGVGRPAFIKSVTAIDFDNDGWQDLYASNLSGDGFLYRNNRNRTFTEVGRAAGVPGTQKAFVSWSFDYDNDGWQDLFVTSYFTSVDETARTYLRLPNNATTLRLYRNRGNGTFEDVTASVGLDKVYMPMGANFGDLDNDGWLDIYLGTGSPAYTSLVPSVLLRNQQARRFADITSSSGTGELHKGHGVAFADLDNDGDQDLVFEVGGALLGDKHALRLFENPGHGNDWIALKLIGARSNRSAIGARIAVTVEGADGRRVMHRTVASGGSFGGSPLLQHIGLGRAARVVSVDVWWPASDTRQTFTGLAANRAFEVTEGVETPKPLARTPLPLAGTTAAGTTGGLRDARTQRR